jgi:hypothetical protein
MFCSHCGAPYARKMGEINLNIIPTKNETYEMVTLVEFECIECNKYSYVNHPY